MVSLISSILLPSPSIFLPKLWMMIQPIPVQLREWLNDHAAYPHTPISRYDLTAKRNAISLQVCLFFAIRPRSANIPHPDGKPLNL